MTRIISMVAGFVLTAACATSGGDTNVAQTDAPLDLANDKSGALALQPVASAALPANECGMVLWTLEGNRPAAVFQFVAGKEAHINIAGQPVVLKRMDYDGAAGYGVFERQTFESPEGITVEVSARFGLEFNGCAYLEQGLIKVRDVSGWSMVSPTAGIAGCRR